MVCPGAHIVAQGSAQRDLPVLESANHHSILTEAFLCLTKHRENIFLTKKHPVNREVWNELQHSAPGNIYGERATLVVCL